MTRERKNDWDLLSMGLGEPAQSSSDNDADQAAARDQARRDHTALLRMYEAFDREHDEQREQLMAELPDSPECESRRRSLGDSAMTYARIRKAVLVLAPAACVVIAVVFALSLGNQSALARAVERLQSIDTIVCQLTTTLSGADQPVNSSGALYISRTLGSRFDIEADGKLVSSAYHPVDGPATILTPMMKTYITLKASKDGVSRPESQPDAWLRKLQELTEDADRELGRATIDGHEAIGYEIAGWKLGLGGRDTGSVATLWIDEQTYLPVRFEATLPGPQAGSTLHVTHDNFEWNRELDASMFEPVVPADYTRMSVSLPKPNEAALLDSLRLYADTLHRYPANLNPAFVSAQLMAGLGAARGIHSIEDISNDPSLPQAAMKIAAGCRFFQGLVRDGAEPEYFGKSVTPDQADAVLIRWNVEDGRQRVVYGDLRVETVAAGG